MSDFVVSARKYRPGNFEELVGQEHVSKTLLNAIKNDKIAHAFLFCGPRGTGKTSSARILARILNCEDPGPNAEPCNECTSCKAFSDNASFNIAELDAASNNSVDAIRNLNDQVRVPPQNGKYRIFIIDEVHMLSAAAFNAFLKTLEEPPPYAIFILATTEKHKILPTILSRCQIFDFKRISISDIVQRLEEICKSEGIMASPDALSIIAQKADGAMRDALSIYDKIVSFSDGQISYENVLEQLNVLDYDYYFRVIDALQTESVSDILLLFNQVLDKGFEADLFINGLASHIRDLLVCKDEQTLELLEVSPGLKERYYNQAASCPSDYLINLLHLANQCDVSYRLAKNKRLHVEMTLIKMTYAAKLTTGEVQIEKKKITPSPKSASKTIVEHPEIITPKDVASNKFSSTATPTKTSEPEKFEIPKIPKVLGEAKFAMPSVGSIEQVKKEIIETEAAHQSDALELTQENLIQEWRNYADGAQSPSLKNTLTKAQIILQENAVQVKVGSKMAQDFVRKELPLTEYLRTRFNVPALQLIVDIDPDMAKAYQRTIKKPMTVKDKYDGFVKINPLVEELRKRFDLKLDQ